MFSSVLNAFTPISNQSMFQERYTELLSLSNTHRSIDFILPVEEIEIEYATSEGNREWLSNLSQNRLFRLYFSGMFTILISLSAYRGMRPHNDLQNPSININNYNNTYEENSDIKKNIIILCAVFFTMISVDLIGQYYRPLSSTDDSPRNSYSMPPDYPTVLKNGQPPPAYKINLQHQTELTSTEDPPKYTTCENSGTGNWINPFNFS